MLLDVVEILFEEGVGLGLKLFYDELVSEGKTGVVVKEVKGRVRAN
jgi:hypothetical protein